MLVIMALIGLEYIASQNKIQKKQKCEGSLIYSPIHRWGKTTLQNIPGKLDENILAGLTSFTLYSLYAMKFM